MPGVGAPDAGKAPSRLNGGPLEPFTRHRVWNTPIHRELCRNPETVDVGRAIANCATRIAVSVAIQDGVPPTTYLKGAQLCNKRLCPFCEWRRTRAWRARLHRGLSEYLEAFPKHRALFLTLTVRNCPLEGLREQVREMNSAWNRMTKCGFFPTEFWFRRTEVTLAYTPGNASCMAHPHFHALLLVKPSYFSHSYVKQSEWQKQWQMAGRLDYQPVVDVRVAKDHSKSGGSATDDIKRSVVEAAKYVTKGSQLMELGRDIVPLHFQLKGLRMYALSRQLSRYVQEADPANFELLDSLPALPAGVPVLDGTAQWFEDTQEYLFTSL